MAEDKPRYSRVSDILDLAVFMSSKIQGVTIKEISERYNVSRRTAERMRDSLTCIFPSIDEISNNAPANMAIAPAIFIKVLAFKSFW